MRALYFVRPLYIHSFNHIYTIHFSVAIRWGLSPSILGSAPQGGSSHWAFKRWGEWERPHEKYVFFIMRMLGLMNQITNRLQSWMSAFLKIDLQRGLAAGVYPSEVNFLLKFYVKNFILQAILQTPQHLYEEREVARSESGSIPLSNRSGSRRPINMGRLPNTVKQ